MRYDHLPVRIRRLLSTALGALVLGAPTLASAQVAGGDVVEPGREEARTSRVDRSWLYVDDAQIPAPLKVIGMFNVSYANIGSPTRMGGTTEGVTGTTYNSLAMNTAQPGAMLGVGGEIGLFPHVSMMTMVQIVQIAASGQAPNTTAGVIAGLRVQAFPSRWRHSHLVVSGGYLREAWQGPLHNDANDTWTPGKPYGDSGAWAQVAFSQDFNRLRIASTVHAEHVFSQGRDPVDVMVQAGASCAVLTGFRLGFEYVGQDLEEAFNAEAEGGARHFMGPIASLQLLNDRLSLVAGPSFGLTPRSPEVLGRAGAAFAF